MAMSEKPPVPKSKSQEEAPAEGASYVVKGETYVTTPEQEEYAKFYAEQHPEIEPVQEMSEECAEKISELETLFANFEQTHDLAALHAIEKLTVEEVKAHVERQAARADLPAIVSLVNYVEKMKNLGIVTEEAWEKLYEQYCVVQRAVGTLNGDFLVHDRP